MGGMFRWGHKHDELTSTIAPECVCEEISCPAKAPVEPQAHNLHDRESLFASKWVSEWVCACVRFQSECIHIYYLMTTTHARNKKVKLNIPEEFLRHGLHDGFTRRRQQEDGKKTPKKNSERRQLAAGSSRQVTMSTRRTQSALDTRAEDARAKTSTREVGSATLRGC